MITATVTCPVCQASIDLTVSPAGHTYGHGDLLDGGCVNLTVSSGEWSKHLESHRDDAHHYATRADADTDQRLASAILTAANDMTNPSNRVIIVTRSVTIAEVLTEGERDRQITIIDTGNLSNWDVAGLLSAGTVYTNRLLADMWADDDD